MKCYRNGGCGGIYEMYSCDECSYSKPPKQIRPLDIDHCQCGMVIDKGWRYCPECGEAIVREEANERK